MKSPTRRATVSGHCHLWLVTHSGKDMKLAARDRLVRRVRVRDGDATVLIAEDDQRRQVCAQSVQRADRLSTVVDHRAQRPKECGATVPVRQRRLPFQRFAVPGDLAAGRQRALSKRLTQLDRRSRGDHLQRDFRTGQRQHPQQLAQIGAKATAADEDQATAILLVLMGELQGDPTTERVADHRGLADVQSLEKVAQPHRERAQRVVATRFVGLSVAKEVNRDDAVLLRELVHQLAPAVRTSADAVDQQQHVARALVQVRHAVAMQGQHTATAPIAFRQIRDCRHGLLLTSLKSMR